MCVMFGAIFGKVLSEPTVMQLPLQPDIQTIRIGPDNSQRILYDQSNN